MNISPRFDTRRFGARRMNRLCPAALILGALGCAAVGTRASAATFSIPNGDVAALKRAINAANSNAQSDTISLAPRGLYTLAQVDNTVNGPTGLPAVQPDSGFPLTLLGNGATITRSGAVGTPGFRFLYNNYYATLGVSNLTLRNGSVVGTGGGAISNAGSLSMESCVLSGNASGQGGALAHYGSVVNLRNCVVSGNRAPFGAGITNFSRLNLFNCTISGNVAASNGGGIDNTYRAVLNAQNCTFSSNRAGGGALHNYGSTATLFGCTISGNIASGRGAGALSVGGLFNATPLNAALSLRACTITGNRAPYNAGLDNIRGQARATLSLRSTIVSGNLASTNADLANEDILQNAGFNLIGGAAGLAPLANNGGPTQTHALLPGSRAINMGDLAPGASFDQRGVGFLRVRGGRADIGAFEVQQAPGPSAIPSA